MALVRSRGNGGSIAPWQDLLDMQNRLRQFLPTPFAQPFLSQALGWTPAVDVSESDGDLVVTAELPGLARDNVDIDLSDGVLTIRGEKQEETERDEQSMHVIERNFGTFSRSFTLPYEVDENKVNAEFRNGILRIVLPRSERARGRKIEIKGN